MSEIDFTEDIIDLWAVAKRRLELQGYAEDDALDSEDAAELEELEAFAAAVLTDTGYDLEELAQNEPTLIADRYFVEYAQELAEDIGAVHGEEGWPLRHVDWQEAARDLQMDYSAVDFDGRRFWVRSY